MTGDLSVKQGWTLVLGSALGGVVLGSHLIADDDDTWWWVILSLMRALTRCAPLVAQTLLGTWFNRWT